MSRNLDSDMTTSAESPLILSVAPGPDPSDRAWVPSIGECDFEYPPIPAPNVVCWHPESYEGRGVCGIGRTAAEAYCRMLANLDPPAYSDLWDPHGDEARDMAGIDPDAGLPVLRGRRRSAVNL